MLASLRMDMCVRNGAEVSLVMFPGALIAEMGLKLSFVWMDSLALFLGGILLVVLWRDADK